MNKVRTVGAVGLIVLLGLGAYTWDLNRHKPNVTSNPTPNTTVVRVPNSTLTSTVVEKVIQDPTQTKFINQLLEENRVLRQQVNILTTTVATLQGSGGLNLMGGTVTIIPQNELVNNPTSLPPQEFEFNDYQLKAEYSSKPSFTYNLHQEFRILTTVGKGKNGSSTSLVKLYQSTPKGDVEVPTTTTEVVATSGGSSWFLSPRIQGGIIGGTSGKGTMIGLQWLRRGTSPATEDDTWSFISPTLDTAGGLGIAPFSYNLGRIKHSPFTNLWVSPEINYPKVGGGVAISATF